MADLQSPPSINDLRSQALLALINRLKALDLTPILVYRIASLVDSAVLPMAWQWDVLNPLLAYGLEGVTTLQFSAWDPITNIDTLTNIDLLLGPVTLNPPSPSAILAAYRALILLSTKLHSTLGTRAALQNALKNLGFPDAVILEGQNSWGGTSYPSSQGWALFRVLINIATSPVPADITLETLLPAICNYWKPARCLLDSVQFQNYLADTLSPLPSDFVINIFRQVDTLKPLPADFIVAPFGPLSDAKTIVPLHDGRYYHIGTTYGANEPHVADSGVIVNGAAISANG